MSAQAKALLSGIVALVLLAAGEGRGEPVVLVNPVLDQSDRLAEILSRLRPSVSHQRVGLEVRFGQRRALGESAPARLRDARVLILENAPLAALSAVRVAGGGRLLDVLPGWIRRGGQLLIVGGSPSYETYGTDLGNILPVVLAEDEEGSSFRRKRRRLLEGSGADGHFVEHLHPVRSVAGDLLIEAGGAPFAVQKAAGDGRVVAVLGGIHAQFRPDGGPEARDYFASEAWPRFVAQMVGGAMKAPLELSPREPALGAVPAVRRGSRVHASDWFPGVSRGTVTLHAPGERVIQREELAAGGVFQLSSELRPGLYEAHIVDGRKTRRRPVLIGEPANPQDFDIRYFSLGIHRNPYGLARGEAYARARELASAGFTSVVFSARFFNRKDNLRQLREIAHAGLQIVYYRSLHRRTAFPKWSFPGRTPHRATNLEGAEIGWDVHDEAFREAFAKLLGERRRDLAIPGLRALQLIEEFADGRMRSPSLRSRMQAAAIPPDVQPGDPAWYRHEEIRSTETGITFQRFRSVGKRLVPGLPHSTYWPGSYWRRTQSYTFRVPELASAVDELLGPGYGYGYGGDAGWLSVVRTAGNIFAAHGHRLAEGEGAAVYAQGRGLVSGEPIPPDAWKETGWTALAHGATGLAYFAAPPGRLLEDLREYHEEVSRIGPWIAAARRRPAKVAILGSWTTRTAGSERETKRHAECLRRLHAALARGVEEVDIVLEEQLAEPPAELRAIVVAGAPVLSDRTIDELSRFVQLGGLLLVDPDAGTRLPDGSPRRNPWAKPLETGRVVRLGARTCSKAWGAPVRPATDWRQRLAKLGIAPTSWTIGERSEARLLGDEEIRYWILLNHATGPAEIHAHSSSSGNGFTWVDLRSGAPAEFTREPRMEVARPIPSRDAVVLLGVRRPAAFLEVEVQERWHQLVVEAMARDAGGEPVADGYPLHLRVRDEAGIEQLKAAARSRVARGGRARWIVPIPLEVAGTRWSVELEEPVSGLRRHQMASLPAFRPETSAAAEATPGRSD